MDTPSSSPAGTYPSSSSSLHRLEGAAILAALGLFALALGLTVWAALPDHRKARISLGLLRSCRRALSLHARHIGVLSMGRELASGGRVRDYEHSYRLALAVDRLDARINLIRAGLS